MLLIGSTGNDVIDGKGEERDLIYRWEGMIKSVNTHWNQWHQR